MANGDHDFTAGEILTAANVDDYLMLQAVQKFATSAARDAALTTRKREGSMSIQDDANTITVYSGAAWSSIGPVHGALTTYTPVVTQSGNVTVTVNRASYIRIGRYLMGDVELTVTGSGTANNAVTVSTPVTMIAPPSAVTVIGVGMIFDASIPAYVSEIAVLKTTTTFAFVDAGSTSAVYAGQTGSGFAVALAVGDKIIFHFACEAAADA